MWVKFEELYLMNVAINYDVNVAVFFFFFFLRGRMNLIV